MTTTSDRLAPALEEAVAEPWRTFEGGAWTDAIDVRDFVQRNYTPYEGDASFLAGPTEKTTRTWETLARDYLVAPILSNLTREVDVL